jgi:DNA-binding NarL/FixJ family response regulator
LNHTFNKSQLVGADNQSNSNITAASTLPFQNLSQRESEILRMIMQGLTTKEIANTQNLRSNTISTYKMRIFEKLNVANVFELAQLIKEHGMFNASAKNTSGQTIDAQSSFSSDFTINI